MEQINAYNLGARYVPCSCCLLARSVDRSLARSALVINVKACSIDPAGHLEELVLFNVVCWKDEQVKSIFQLIALEIEKQKSDQCEAS